VPLKFKVRKPKHIYQNFIEFDWNEVSQGDYKNTKVALWKKLNCFVTLTFLYVLAFYVVFGGYDVIFTNSRYLAEKYYWLVYFSSSFIPFM
jgi:hypothetical protein